MGEPGYCDTWYKCSLYSSGSQCQESAVCQVCGLWYVVTLNPLIICQLFIFADLHQCIYRTELSTGSSMKITHQPVYLRSWKLPTPKPSNAAKITQALSESGINYQRLVMPTRENVVQLEALYEAANALVDTKKVIDRVEQEICMMKEKKNGRTSLSRSETMDVDAETKNESEEVGKEAVNEDNGRAHSVSTSTRSAMRRRVSKWAIIY